MIRVGVFAKTFVRASLGDALDAVVAAGLEAMQFNLALTGGPSLPRQLPMDLADEVRVAVGARGLRMEAVSGTYNMAHPDPVVRDDGAGRLRALIAAAPRLGTRVVTLCTGTRDPDDMWRAHPGNVAPDAWRDAAAQIAAALAVAEEHGVVLAVEPEHGNVVSDARRARRLLDDMRSAHLKVVLDAANLVQPGELHHQRETLREAFELLGQEVVLAHAKDLTDDGTIVAAGRGRLDYPLYLRLLSDTGYDGALVLHGLPEAHVPAAAAFLHDQLERAVA